MIILGIDPGERWTGLALRDGRDVTGWLVIDRRDLEPADTTIGVAYLTAVEAAARDMTHTLIEGADLLVAVEDFHAPVGFRSITPRVMVGMGRLVGYLQRAFPDAVLVDPPPPGVAGKAGATGMHPLSAYPDALVSDRERANAHRKRSWGMPAPQNGDRKHARAAYDVAGAALATARRQAAIETETIRKDARRGRLA